jgi:broad specificity phosphatase PhoE/predicted kinase
MSGSPKTVPSLPPPAMDDSTKVAFAMVGLPARGKSFIARKIARYLSWLGYRARVFNVGGYRRREIGERMTHAFFDPDHEEAQQARLEVALRALDDMCHWLRGEGEVAVYDATNSTRARRRLIAERCARERIELVFIETICETPALIEEAIRATKLHSPDYAGLDPEEAARDFRMRIAHYRRAYEPLGDEELSWVKLVEDRQLVINRVDGEIPSRVVRLLMSLRHRTARTIWLTRHGESISNLDDRIGGDAPLSERGRAFARGLAAHFSSAAERPALVWTSTLGRTIETAAPLGIEPVCLRALDEIDVGICDGMRYVDVEREMPDEYRARCRDKLRYRYPRGESYLDVIARIEPVVIELERDDVPLLIVGHQAALRVLYGYFAGHPAEACPHLDIPLHHLIELRPTPQGHAETRHALGPLVAGPAVDEGPEMR